MRHVQISLLLIVAAFATGCPKYRPDVRFDDPGSLVTRINNYIVAQNTLYMAALGNHPEQAKLIRNELIERALPFIDGAYIDFITAIQAGRDRNNFVMDLVELGTAASVGITKGERSLQIIGVALTAFRGGRRSLDANFYKDQSTPILISKMDGNRAKVRATILNRERDSVEDYPLGAAIGDLVDYYNAGTLVRAFTELQKDTALQTRAAEDDVLVLKGVSLTRPATAEDARDAQNALPVLADLFDALESSDNAVSAAALKKLQAIVKELEDDPAVAPSVMLAGISSADTDGKKIINGLKAIKRSQPTDSDVDRRVNRAINTKGK